MRTAVALLSSLGLALLAGCGDAHDHQASATDAAAGAWAGVERAVCVLTATDGNAAHGTVTFTKTGDGVKVVAEVSGLNPNQAHAIHIHEYGDLRSADGSAAAGHYNPEGHEHGLPDVEKRHAGDFGNLQADADGNARLELTATNITIAGPTNPIVGRGMIVHAEPDDGGQPVGNAGARIAQGVIGVAK